MADLLTFRDSIRQGSPTWLQGRFGERLLYSWGLVTDGLMDILTLAVRARFPLGGALDVSGALEILGRDRRLARGDGESAEDYAARLPDWLTTHATRGGPYALLEQLRIKYKANPFPIALVYLGSGKRYLLPTDGSPITTDTVTIPATSQWCRWMLVYQLPGVIPRDGTWGSPGVWDDGGVWDLEMSHSEIDDLLRIPSDWNAAHSIGYLALLDDTTTDLWAFPGGALTLTDPPRWVGASNDAPIFRVPSPVVLI